MQESSRFVSVPACTHTSSIVSVVRTPNTQHRPRALYAGVLLAAAGLPVHAQVSTLWNAPTRGVGVAVTAADDSYTADFEVGPGQDISVTKRDAAGNLLWTAQFDQTDSTKWERAQWIESDPAGNAIVCGTLMSGFLNPVTAASLLMKYSPQGNLLWRRVFDGPFDASQTRQCHVDEGGSIYVLGLGSGPGGYVTKLRKYSADGDVVWTYFDPVGIGFPQRMKASSDGGFLISGRSLFGSLNGFAKVDSAGNHVWHRVGLSSLAAGDGAPDAWGNSYLVGSEFGPGATRITKVDSQGATIWEQLFPHSGSRVEVGPDDCPVVSGFPSSGSPGAAFLKVDPDGNLLWANADADGPQALLLHGRLLLDASGDAYLSAGTLFQMAVCKVRGSDGAGVWTALISGSSSAAGMDLSPSTNSVFVVGGTTARLLDGTEGVWADQGQSLATTGPAPRLVASGLLAPLEALRFDVSHAPATTPGIFVLGLSQAQLPLFGGTLVPSPDVLLPTTTDALGRDTLGGILGSAVPSGLSLWVQAWFLAPREPESVRATNARSSTAL